MKKYDVIVIGSGHAGCESAYASAKMGKKTLLLTMNLDSIAFLACNPSIGGTAKGQLAGEVDALGGAMGKITDKTKLQIRILNEGKGPAVQSLRAQVDKNKYHTEMKKLIENTRNLFIVQGEAKKILTKNGCVTGVETTFDIKYFSHAVIVSTGVYLKSEITIGKTKQKSGPNGFAPANYLTDSIKKLGHKILRFKTGTPARIHSDSIDFSKFEIQDGIKNKYFSDTLNKSKLNLPCYLGYTNEKTHKIIKENLHLAPIYTGSVFGIGPRYCPSIETKIVRFKDKERHQLFLEPEALDTKEIYIQGMSTSFPASVQEKMYRSIEGFENAHIMRYAYAIEYDCIDPTILTPYLMSKKVEGLFFAGQINGTSGYEEAAGQGIVAGINAVLFLDKKEPFVLKRNEAYIGVLIDDLINKGVDEPYRMMTSRAEFRLLLRQDNCDLRLKDYGIKFGLIKGTEKTIFLDKKENLEKAKAELKQIFPPKKLSEYFKYINESIPKSGLTLKEILRRNGADAFSAKQYLNVFKNVSDELLELINTQVKYEGYIAMQNEMIEVMLENEKIKLPQDFDYNKVKGLRIEATQKLNEIKPLSLGQASRISGVSPADISVILVYLKQNKMI